MLEYTLSVALANNKCSINNPRVRELLKEAVKLTNQSQSARQRGRLLELSDDPVDDTHARIVLRSATDVIPTRALSGLSRALMAVDRDNIISSYRGCIFQAALLDEQPKKVKNISDVELIQTLISMTFGQAQIRSNKEKELAKEYIDKIRALVTEYLSQTML